VGKIDCGEGRGKKGNNPATHAHRERVRFFLSHPTLLSAESWSAKGLGGKSSEPPNLSLNSGGRGKKLKRYISVEGRGIDRRTPSSKGSQGTRKNPSVGGEDTGLPLHWREKKDLFSLSYCKKKERMRNVKSGPDDCSRKEEKRKGEGKTTQPPLAKKQHIISFYQWEGERGGGWGQQITLLL